MRCFFTFDIVLYSCVSKIIYEMYSVFLGSFCIVLYVVSPFVLSLSYLCTSLPTTATMWKPNCSK